jgi:hypothetical protein
MDDLDDRMRLGMIHTVSLNLLPEPLGEDGGRSNQTH